MSPMKYIALVAALGLTGCCGSTNAPAMLTPTPYAAPAASPCAVPEAPKASPSSCNAPATATSSSGVPMSAVAMPTFVAKAAVVPPNVIICIVNGVRCLLDTLISPFKP